MTKGAQENNGGQLDLGALTNMLGAFGGGNFPGLK